MLLWMEMQQQQQQQQHKLHARHAALLVALLMLPGICQAAPHELSLNSSATPINTSITIAQIPLPGGLQVNCSSPLTRLFGNVITIGPADVCHDFGMGSPKIIPCVSE
jgi:hypothetical protein